MSTFFIFVLISCSDESDGYKYRLISKIEFLGDSKSSETVYDYNDAGEISEVSIQGQSSVLPSDFQIEYSSLGKIGKVYSSSNQNEVTDKLTEVTYGDLGEVSLSIFSLDADYSENGKRTLDGVINIQYGHNDKIQYYVSDGVVIEEYVYNSDDRLESIIQKFGSEYHENRFTYSNGKVSTLNISTNQYSYIYDDSGRLVEFVKVDSQSALNIRVKYQWQESKCTPLSQVNLSLLQIRNGPGNINCSN